LRIATISDMHGYLPEPGFVPECDLLLIGGDVCPVWDHNRQYQARWLRAGFRDWLKQQPAKTIMGIGGNHDFVLQESEKIGYELPWVYLNNEAWTFSVGDDAVKVWGSAFSPTFGNWAFMRDDRALAEVWETIPSDVDIILVHGPAFGYGDRVRNDWNPDPNVGSKTLMNRLWYGEFPKLKLIVSGHIHEGYGLGQMKLMNDQLVAWVNASYVDEDYNTGNPVQVFDL
jgi:predicted phosphodiesterase